jgi:hypothetical protein
MLGNQTEKGGPKHSSGKRVGQTWVGYASVTFEGNEATQSRQ